jgi:siroheme synthase
VANNRYVDRRVILGLALASHLLLSACGTEAVKDSPSAAPDPVAGNAAPAPGTAAPAPGIPVAPLHSAPTIAGTPVTTATVGSPYSFTASAADADQQTLGFSITNKPAWASFNTATGTLTGTPGSANVGSFGNILISVSDGSAQAALPPFSITVQAAPGTTTSSGAPTLSGAPPTAVRAGSPYAFQPAATDPDADALTFAINGKPAWAAFNTATGALTGTPGAANLGSFSNILISVSDGSSVVSLPSFSILVTSATTGSAALSWTPPTQNTDGSSLTNLAGYRIYYGTDPQALGSHIEISNPGITAYTVGNLSTGSYYFSVSAYTSNGAESMPSVVGSKVIF